MQMSGGFVPSLVSPRTGSAGCRALWVRPRPLIPLPLRRLCVAEWPWAVLPLVRWPPERRLAAEMLLSLVEAPVELPPIPALALPAASVPCASA